MLRYILVDIVLPLLLFLFVRAVLTAGSIGSEAADLDRKGAAGFHRQLVKGDLASEYEHDIRAWLEQLA